MLQPFVRRLRGLFAGVNGAPTDAAEWLRLAKRRLEAKDPAAAVDLLERAAQSAPNQIEIHFELALALNQLGGTQRAAASYERVLALMPDHVPALINLGLLHLSQLGDAARARQLFERAVALQPDSVAAQANLGIALQEQGQFGAALAHYERLIAASPAEFEYRWNRGLVLLHQGDFERGWEDYELRSERGAKSVGRRRFAFPEWDGSDLAGRQILVYAEQGLGDEIMFASCLPDVLRSASDVVIECDPRLVRLYQRSFPATHVHGAARNAEQDWLTAFPGIETQIRIGSLPRFFRRTRTDFPQESGYLKVDLQRRSDWHKRLSGFGNKPKIGLCWRGGTLKTRRELRSLALSDCLPLLMRDDVDFVSLQTGDCAEEIAEANRRGGRLLAWPDAVDDMDELAALVDALDAVITVSSTVLHLSGAIGKPAYGILSANPEWRYLQSGEALPWHPSVRLLRQAQAGDWSAVIARLSTDMAGVA